MLGCRGGGVSGAVAGQTLISVTSNPASTSLFAIRLLAVVLGASCAPQLLSVPSQLWRCCLPRRGNRPWMRTAWRWTQAPTPSVRAAPWGFEVRIPSAVTPACWRVLARGWTQRNRLVPGVAQPLLPKLHPVPVPSHEVPAHSSPPPTLSIHAAEVTQLLMCQSCYAAVKEFVKAMGPKLAVVKKKLARQVVVFDGMCVHAPRVGDGAAVCARDRKGHTRGSRRALSGREEKYRLALPMATAIM